MTSGPGIERLRAARAAVEKVCQELALPSAAVLDRSVRGLNSICTQLGNPESWRSPGPHRPETLDELQQLHAAIQKAARLLHVAQDYYAHWSKTLSMLTSGYTPAGIEMQSRRGAVNLTG
jgi:hypothetical protein